MGLKVTRNGAGDIELSGLAPWIVAMLRELTDELRIAPDSAIGRRLFPDPYDAEEEQENAEWRRLVHPDLFALMASARAILASDLEQLEIEGDAGELVARVCVPATHVHAWLHSLGAARQALAAAHEIGEEDMGEEELEIFDERTAALAPNHLLGWLQQLLVECEAEDLG